MNAQQKDKRQQLNSLKERLSDVPCSRGECRYYGIRFDRNCSAKVGGEAATKTCVMYRPEKETAEGGI